MPAIADEFDWKSELEKTVVHSLTTSFGLDFLFFKDKEGGDVDTIRNARKGVYATSTERNIYENRDPYDKVSKDAYHSHENYKKRGLNDKQKMQEGTLHDMYREGSPRLTEPGKRDLDHVISAHEIHNDPGRILADLNGVELANQDSNLQSTHSSINRSKKQKSVDQFLAGVQHTLKNETAINEKQKEVLSSLPRDTPQQQQAARELEDKIRKREEKIASLEAIDPEAMRKVDAAARAEYESKINFSYYTGSKFLTNTALASAGSGLRMGVRQALGMIAAEVWMELRIRLPRIYLNLRNNFSFGRFISRLGHLLKAIWSRVSKKLGELIRSFKDGAIAGALSSLTTTIFNIFSTTSRNAVKIIREIFGSLVSAFKILVFNPDKLGFNERNQKIIKVLSAGAATVVGALVYAKLAPVLSFPFGGELAAFAAALVTGLVTLGLTWMLFHSPLMRKLWDFIDRSAHLHTVRQFQEANRQLDEYLLELGRIELNMQPYELEILSTRLDDCHSEGERNSVLSTEVARRKIQMPFEMGNTASTRKWLNDLTKA